MSEEQKQQILKQAQAEKGSPLSNALNHIAALQNAEQFDQLIINYVRANKRDSSVFETENQL